MGHGTDEAKKRRKWPYVVTAVLLTPIGVVIAAKGADNWCDSELMEAGDGNYQNKQLSVSALPPGVRCTGDTGGRQSESLWPINW